MKSEIKYGFSDSTYIEPLVNQWPAWSYLISPLPASLHLVNYQIKIMESYSKDPAAHIAAAKEPSLVSGPFVNVPIERSQEVTRLLADTKKKQARNIELADAFMRFANRLVAEAKGQTLETYYRQLPEILRGSVELVYDYYHRPSVRVIESLLYNSPLYDVGLQALRIGRLQTDASRTFILNTPHLLRPGEIDWSLPFADPRADELFQLDAQPKTMDRILDIIGQSSVTAGTILPFLSDQQVMKREPWQESHIRIRYIGHACVLVEWQGTSILTDAYIPVQPAEGGAARFTFRDLPEKIDFVVITHNHQDHYVFETLLRLRHRIQCLVVPKSYGILYGDLSLRLLSQRLGFRNVVEVDALDSIPFPDGEILAIPFFGEHADLAHGKTAYVIRCGKEQMLFAADSDCLDARMYERVRQAIGPVQTAFLSVENIGAPLSWVNGPFLPEQPRPDIEQQRRYHACDVYRGLELLESLDAQRVFSYAMGFEPWVEHLLGLNMTEESEQWKQSERLLDSARGRGFWTIERLCGKTSIYLGGGRSTAEVDREPHGQHPQSGYWTERFKGVRHPTFTAQSAQSQSQGRRKIQSSWMLSKELPPDLTDTDNPQLRLAAFTIAAFLGSLCQMTDQEDFAIITRLEADGRPRNRADSKMLPLRVDISGDPTFRKLLERIERAVRAAQQHELDSSTIERILKEVFVKKDPSEVRLGFAFDGYEPADYGRAPMDQLDCADVELIVRRRDAQSFDVLSNYDESVVHETVAGKLYGNFAGFVAVASRDPGKALSDINSLLLGGFVSAEQAGEAEFSF